MLQFSLKRMMLAVACFAASCAGWASLGRINWQDDSTPLACMLLSVAGFGASVGIPLRQGLAGTAISVMLFGIVAAIIITAVGL